MKKKTIAFITVLSLLVAAFFPFFLNDVINAAYYNPTDSVYLAQCAETVAASMYPETKDFEFIPRRRKSVNFGEYTFTVNTHFLTRNANEVYSCKYRRGKAVGTLSEAHSDLSVPKSLFEGEALSYDDIVDDAKYFLYFAVDGNGFDALVNTHLITRYVFGMEFSDCVWGAPNKFGGYDKPEIMLYAMMSKIVYLLQQGKNYEVLNGTGLFGDLQSYVFSFDYDLCYPLGFTAYGNGEEFKAFQTQNVKLVKIIKCGN